ncbi:MAG: hypothetical protein ACREL6_10880 [Gemmatimonadales bacterium]
MPRLSVWIVRTALVYLIAGFAFGALMLSYRAEPFTPGFIAGLRPLHIEFLTLGWTVNLGLGVGYWILPRPPGGAEAGSGAVMVLAFALLNVGVLSVGAGEALDATVLPLLGRLAEASAAAAFAFHAWRRVRPTAAHPARRAPPGQSPAP